MLTPVAEANRRSRQDQPDPETNRENKQAHQAAANPISSNQVAVTTGNSIHPSASLSVSSLKTTPTPSATNHRNGFWRRLIGSQIRLEEANYHRRRANADNSGLIKTRLKEGGGRKEGGG